MKIKHFSIMRLILSYINIYKYLIFNVFLNIFNMCVMCNISLFLIKSYPLISNAISNFYIFSGRSSWR